LGLDARELTPVLVQRVVHAAAEARSYKRAAIVMRQIADCTVSSKTISRIALEIGRELAARRDAGAAGSALAQPSAAPPELSVVQCDGGRIRTRQPGQGAGVHGEAWRETKNACLLRMTCQRSPSDPQPELPPAFRNPEKVAELAEKPPLAGLSVALRTEPRQNQSDVDWRPKRLLRTCLSSMADARTFGLQMQREACQRRFFESPARAFIGDGLPWNWSIWKQHFPAFVPILDFIHVLSYIYQAALALRSEPKQVWACYEGLASACWQGRVSEVITALEGWLAEQDSDARDWDADDPRQAVLDAVRYLTNNQHRMDYPAYRRAGLPVTSALMESMVKEINHRVKGTEMFWNDPEGAEAILQIRAAALSDDNRLTRHLATRRGSPYVRRSSPYATAA